MSKSSDVIFSYHDSLLRQKDIDLLQGPYWINDNILSFYFEFLNMENSSKIAKFMCPDVTQLIKLSSSATRNLILNPLKLKEYEFIFFPLNDLKSRDQAGGTHWTLLVFSKIEQTFYHFDSASISNPADIQNFANKLVSLLTKETANIVEVKCPQQSNGVDCGLYVMCYADLLLQHICKYSKIEECDFSHVTELVASKRKSLLDLVKMLCE